MIGISDLETRMPRAACAAAKAWAESIRRLELRDVGGAPREPPRLDRFARRGVSQAVGQPASSASSDGGPARFSLRHFGASPDRPRASTLRASTAIRRVDSAWVYELLAGHGPHQYRTRARSPKRLQHEPAPPPYPPPASAPPERPEIAQRTRLPVPSRARRDMQSYLPSQILTTACPSIRAASLCLRPSQFSAHWSASAVRRC